MCGATNHNAYFDLKLVVNQILSEFKVNEASMRSYYALVLRLAAKFQSFNLIKIVGQDNCRADRLAKQAALGKAQDH